MMKRLRLNSATTMGKHISVLVSYRLNSWYFTRSPCKHKLTLPLHNSFRIEFRSAQRSTKIETDHRRGYMDKITLTIEEINLGTKMCYEKKDYTFSIR